MVQGRKWEDMQEKLLLLGMMLDKDSRLSKNQGGDGEMFLSRPFSQGLEGLKKVELKQVFIMIVIYQKYK